MLLLTFNCLYLLSVVLKAKTQLAKLVSGLCNGFFIGLFSELRKETISFVVSVRLSVCMELIWSNWADCH